MIEKPDAEKAWLRDRATSLKAKVLREVAIRFINPIGIVGILVSMGGVYADDMFVIVWGLCAPAACLVLNIFLNSYRMEQISQESVDRMAAMLYDPKVTIEDLKIFKEKAKIMIETIEMAQDAENRQIKKAIRTIVRGEV